MSRMALDQESLIMADPFDDWKTADPNDRDVCVDHGLVLPCAICKMEYEEYQQEREREEGR